MLAVGLLTELYWLTAVRHYYDCKRCRGVSVQAACNLHAVFVICSIQGARLLDFRKTIVRLLDF